jgi:seryl-tRNA synthetase
MKLNAEQIIKALECFHQRILKTDLAKKITETEMMSIIDALALIKELTEENERLKSEVSVKRKLLDKAEVRIECVEEENNQLKADICNAEMNLGHITEDSEAKDETITNLIATIKDIQADTVRKMQEMLHERFKSDANLVYSNYNIHRYIDQIEKEMLEGENEH